MHFKTKVILALSGLILTSLLAFGFFSYADTKKTVSSRLKILYLWHRVL